MSEPIIVDVRQACFWTLVGFVVYAVAISLVHDEPEPKLYVEDSEIARCLPENQGDIALMRLDRHKDGTPYLACEKHEPMGYGRMPRKPTHIQVAISRD